MAVTYEEEDSQGETWWHIAHIGLDKNGKIVRFSDNNEDITDTTIKAINRSAQYLNEKARTWNYVVVKNKY